MTWTCRRCSCVFAVGLSMCPQCTGTDVFETGSEAAVSVEAGALTDVEASPAEQAAAAADEAAHDYAAMKVDELRALLETRGLDTSGLRADLVERLEVDDAKGPADDGA